MNIKIQIFLCLFHVFIPLGQNVINCTKRRHTEKSDNASSPLLWMLVKQFDRMDGKLNDVQKCCHNNQLHIKTTETGANGGTNNSKDTAEIKVQLTDLKDMVEKEKGIYNKRLLQLESERRQLETKCTNLERSLMEAQRNISHLHKELKEMKHKMRCPTEWTLNSDHCYLFGDDTMSWDSAKEICQRKGGYLVKVDSETENSWLKSKIQGNKWIGASDIEKESEFRWVSDNTRVTFTKWKQSEPNGGRGENCVHFHDKQPFDWNDAPCDYLSGFICEKSTTY